jgi:hypothetical protein
LIKCFKSIDDDYWPGNIVEIDRNSFPAAPWHTDRLNFVEHFSRRSHAPADTPGYPCDNLLCRQRLPVASTRMPNIT